MTFSRWRARMVLLAVIALGLPLLAQYVAPYIVLSGYLTSSSGLPAQNATLTFQPSQVFFVAGSQVVVAQSQCATDVSGLVVGVGNPLSPPRGSAQVSGTLPVGNYYIKFTWYDQFGAQTLPSPEIAVQLTAVGELQILPPIGNGPPNATGMDVYIGTAPGGETLQGQTTSTTAQFTQAVPLVAGATPPILNSTACRVIANDAGWPTGTGYTVSLTDASGNTLFSYPEMWQFFGPGSTYNLSQGIPYYHGQVTYPVPILTTPYNHNIQSISSPVSLGVPGNYYALTGVQALGVDTNTPGWGVDVEGAGLLSDINAAGGYLVNGNGGTFGQCLGSNGLVFNTAINCGFFSPDPNTPHLTVGPALGTGGTATLVNGSNDGAGEVTTLTGTSPTTGVIFTLAFGGVYTSNVFCLFLPSGLAAPASINGYTGGAGVGLTSVSLFNEGTPFNAASTQLIIFYICHP